MHHLYYVDKDSKMIEIRYGNYRGPSKGRPFPYNSWIRYINSLDRREDFDKAGQEFINRLLAFTEEEWDAFLMTEIIEGL
jgi:hypothetical protein